MGSHPPRGGNRAAGPRSAPPDLTDEGRARLAELLRSGALRRAFVPSPFDAVIGVLAYSDALDRKGTMAVLEARREALGERLAREHPLADASVLERRFGFLARSLYGKSRRSLEVEIAWLDGVIDRIRQGPIRAPRVPERFLDVPV